MNIRDKCECGGELKEEIHFFDHPFTHKPEYKVLKQTCVKCKHRYFRTIKRGEYNAIASRIHSG